MDTEDQNRLPQPDIESVSVETAVESVKGVGEPLWHAFLLSKEEFAAYYPHFASVVRHLSQQAGFNRSVSDKFFDEYRNGDTSVMDDIEAIVVATEENFTEGEGSDGFAERMEDVRNNPEMYHAYWRFFTE